MGDQNYWERAQYLYLQGLLGKRVGRRKALRAATYTVAGLASLPYLACGKKEEPKAAVTGSTEGGAKKGGVLVYADSGDPGHLDPHREADYRTANTNGLHYENLINWNEPDEYGVFKAEPALAEKWNVSPDGKEYTFFLRPKAKWHNKPPVNGREFTADDVKWNFDRIRRKEPQYNLAPMFEMIDTIQVVDKKTVKFILKEPSPAFLPNIGDAFVKLIPKELDEGDRAKRIAIGTGPFILDSWDSMVKIRWVRNPDYDIPGLPYLDGVECRILPDNEAVLAAFKAKQLTVLNWMTGESNHQRLLKEYPEGKYFVLDGQSTAIAQINCTKPPFNDVRVRQALRLCVNVEENIKGMWMGVGGYKGVFYSFVKPWALPDAEVRRIMTPDIEKAKRLLAEAGYPNGVKVVDSAQSSATRSLILKEQAAKAGIDIEVKVLDFLQWRKAVFAGGSRDYQMSVDGEWAFVDPDRQLLNYYACPDGPLRPQQNNTGYCNPKVDELLAKEKVEMNVEKRKELVWEIQRIILDEAPQVWLGYGNTYQWLQPNVRGWKRIGAAHSSWRHLGSGVVWLDR